METLAVVDTNDGPAFIRQEGSSIYVSYDASATGKGPHLCTDGTIDRNGKAIHFRRQRNLLFDSLEHAQAVLASAACGLNKKEKTWKCVPLF